MGIWNISLYNAYSRMNPIVIEKYNTTYNHQYWTSPDAERPKFMALALFPIIPSVSYTYKF